MVPAERGRPSAGWNRRAVQGTAVLLQGAGEMVGYATFYHGYPDDGTLWVTFFCVHRSGQRQGYGGQFVEGLAREARRVGFRRMMLAVALKNWAAIRF
ncbi:MAG: GNAT family N-acetyltransferase [Thermaerobacter sp.]|nr:GNAT family N-acetyltransferase [Thermaerobacter sp.]